MPTWYPAAIARLPREQAALLRETGSFTRALGRACGEPPRVRLLDQGWGRPRGEEVRALALAEGRFGLIRRVELHGGAEPVFARTVIPPATIAARPGLGRMGERALGAALFADPAVVRGRLEVARLEPGMALHAEAGGGGGPRWARRSLFRVGGKALLVCEVLPPLKGDDGTTRSR